MRCRRSATKRNPFARNGRWTSKTEEKLRFNFVQRNPFARNGRWTSKTEEKLRVYFVHRDPFARNGRWTSKTEENCDLRCPRATLLHEMDVERRGLRKIASLRWPRQPVRTKWTLKIKNWGKLRKKVSRRNPFARNGPWTSKTEEKLRFHGSGLYICESICV